MKSLIHTLEIGLALISFLASSQLDAYVDGDVETGIVVSRLNRTLILQDADGATKYNREIPVDVPITLDGKPAKLEDLMAGDYVKLSMSQQKTVTSVEAKSGKLRKTSQ